MKIYQLYYSDETFNKLQPGFTPRKNINPSPDSLYRENMDVIDIYYNTDWRKEDYIGLVSWRFFEKTGLTYEDVVNQMNGYDCYLMSPKKFNNYEHTFSSVGDKGILEICDYFDNKNIVPYKLKYYPAPKSFCNFWIMTPELFESYAKFLLKFIDEFETDRNTFKFRDYEFMLPYRSKCKTICLFFEGLLGVWLTENKVKFKYIQDKAPKESILTQLAIKYGTDKWNSHYYTEHYHKLFKDRRTEKITMLEIGIGGDENPNKGGESLSMWSDYFSNGQIFGVDICKKNFKKDRCRIYQCSQVDQSKMESIATEAEFFDYIIDDGSHENIHVVPTFKFMFKWLKPNGIYIVEDCQTSYWWPGEPTMMEYFKSLCDGINHAEIKDRKPDYFDLNITEIRFIHNLIIIFKGENTEKSNIIQK